MILCGYLAIAASPAPACLLAASTNLLQGLLTSDTRIIETDFPIPMSPVYSIFFWSYAEARSTVTEADFIIFPGEVDNHHNNSFISYKSIEAAEISRHIELNCPLYL